VNYAQKKFIAYVKNLRPRSVDELRPEYHPRYIAEGAYRQTFDVRRGTHSLGLVIKFPFDGTGDPLSARQIARAIAIATQHSRDDYEAITRILTVDKFIPLRRYMPKVLHFDADTGVIVMPKYKRIKLSKGYYVFARTLTHMVEDLIPEMIYEFDYCFKNFGIRDDGQYILLDAGLLGCVRKPRCR
jgi:hypothetical protein